MRLTFPLVLNLVLMLGLSGCQTKSSVEKNAPLVDAAHETYARYVRAMRGYGGEDPTPDEIPRQYWAEGIKKLKPIKVYKHRINIVVVQKVSDNVEEGKYIHNPVSSYLPKDGIDGFTLRPNPLKGNKYHLGDGIFDYQRTIKY
jgi:hypothetical protein